MRREWRGARERLGAMNSAGKLQGAAGRDEGGMGGRGGGVRGGDFEVGGAAGRGCEAGF